MSEPRAIIAEDEALLRDELKQMLAKLWPELILCAEAEDGIEAVQVLAAHAPDILFLDIEMPGIGGLDVARQASSRCHVVFVTAFDEHAVAAFDEGAVDYVLKPLSMARLARTVARLKERICGAPPNLDSLLQRLTASRHVDRSYLRWISVPQGKDLHLITVEGVCYFKADTKYTLVVTADQESLIRRSIRELAEELDPNLFWQIHRGTLVNVNSIAGITRALGGRMHVRLKGRKETLPVSEPYLQRFRQL